MDNLKVYAQNITELVHMREALTIYGVDVNGAGFAVCPFHSEKTASMKVYYDHFYCFGCGKSGDVITFVREMFDMDFTDALKKINTDFSLNLPIDKRMSVRQARHYKNLLEEIEYKRLSKQKKHERKHAEYLDLLYSATGFERDKKKFAPKSPFETPHPLFLNAIKWLDYVNYRLDNFDWEEE